MCTQGMHVNKLAFIFLVKKKKKKYRIWSQTDLRLNLALPLRALLPWEVAYDL